MYLRFAEATGFDQAVSESFYYLGKLEVDLLILPSVLGISQQQRNAAAAALKEVIKGVDDVDFIHLVEIGIAVRGFPVRDLV